MKITCINIRLPKDVYDELHKKVLTEQLKGNKMSKNTYMVEAIRKALKGDK